MIRRNKEITYLFYFLESHSKPLSRLTRIGKKSTVNHVNSSYVVKSIKKVTFFASLKK